jgi:hypothetical protein
VLQSGLTLGEAALIQPFYAPPFADIPMDTLSGTGTGFYAPATFVNGMGERTIANGLRYENFSWRKLTNINVVPDINRTPPGFPFEIIEYGGISGIWQSETRNDIGMRTDYRYVVGGGGYPDYYVGPHANLLTLAPVNDFNDEVLHSIGTSLSAFALSFDVVANHPAVALERVGAYITNGFVMGRVETWSFVTHPSSSVQLVKFPYEMQGSPTVNHAPSDAILDSLYASVDYTGWASGTIGQHYDSTSLQSLKRVTVHAFMLVRDWEEGLPNSSLFGALTFDVGVVSLVPEPTTGVLALSMAAVGLLWRRSN